MPNYLRYAIIILLASFLFLPFLGQVHLFDWDEINFAECAREMIVSKDYLRSQIDFMPFWEKPPFFIWMQVIAMKLFGVGEYAARFPNALIGVITVTTLFYVGNKVLNRKLATWWSLLYAASWLPHFYFKSGIIDPTFNFFIFLAFFQMHLLRFGSRKMMHALLAGLFLGMAVLTKGPVAILIALLALVVYLILNRGLSGYKIGHILLIAVVAAIPMLAWLGVAIAHYGQAYGKWFVSEFIQYQIRLFQTEDADHGGPFFYHFIVLLVGCFPASLFLFQYSGKRVTERTQSADFTRWMWILFWVVLILFSIVQTKIVHYSSLCYFPLTYLAALQVHRLSDELQRVKKVIPILIGVIGSLIAVLLMALPVVAINKQKLIPYINDPFAAANFQANVPWSYAECLWGLLYLAGIWATVVLLKKNFRQGMIVLGIIQIITIQATILHFTPKIEAYSQRASVDFCKSFEGKDVYVHALGYKSYAIFFYTQKRPYTNSNYVGVRSDKNGKDLQPEANEGWLLWGQVDKPTYFICKIQNGDKYAALPQLTKIGESNGFVFLKRNDFKGNTPK